MGGRQSTISRPRDVRHDSGHRDSRRDVCAAAITLCIITEFSDGCIIQNRHASMGDLLMFAPTDISLRAFCSRVRSMCSDQGAERKIAQQMDIVEPDCPSRSRSTLPFVRAEPRLEARMGWHDPQRAFLTGVVSHLAGVAEAYGVLVP